MPRLRRFGSRHYALWVRAPNMDAARKAWLQAHAIGYTLRRFRRHRSGEVSVYVAGKPGRSDVLPMNP